MVDIYVVLVAILGGEGWSNRIVGGDEIRDMRKVIISDT